MQHRLLIALVALVGCAIATMPIASAAPGSKQPSTRQQQIEYVGMHPLPVTTGGFCQIEGPHIHVVSPEHADVLYRMRDGRFYFVGDPKPFGYDGPTHAYYGHHPIVDDDEDHHGFCYLDGPHYHLAPPRPSTTFVVHGGASWYVGDWPRHYTVEAPRYTKINVVYAPLLYARPVVLVGPPAGYRPPILALHVKVVPRAVVTRPVVYVELQMPWIVVDVNYDYDLYYHRDRRRRGDD